MAQLALDFLKGIFANSQMSSSNVTTFEPFTIDDNDSNITTTTPALIMASAMMKPSPETATNFTMNATMSKTMIPAETATTDGTYINLFLVKLDYDENMTCDSLFPSTNRSTIIRIDRGWASIPETIVIDLFICFLVLLPYIGMYWSIHNYGRHWRWVSWMRFLNSRPGDELPPRNTIIPILRRLKRYFDRINSGLLSLLPYHFGPPCPVMKGNENNGGGNKTQSDQQPTAASAAAATQERPAKLPIMAKITVTNNQNNNGGMIDGVGENQTIRRLKQIWHMVWTLNITDSQILCSKGHDAYQYLLFQRYLIVLCLFITFVSMLIILPINVLYGGSGCRKFGCTSINNITRPHMIWVHAVMAVSIILAAIYLMNRFAQELIRDGCDYHSKQRRILLVHYQRSSMLFRRMGKTADQNNHHQQQQPGRQSSTVSVRRARLLRNLKERFQTQFGDVELIGIQLVFDVGRLTALQESFRDSYQALRYCRHPCTDDTHETNRQQRSAIAAVVSAETQRRQQQPQQQQQKTGNNSSNSSRRQCCRRNRKQPPPPSPRIYRCCGCCFGCCCRCCTITIGDGDGDKSASEQFYRNETERYRQDIEQELENILNKQNCRAMFVEFKDQSQAAKVFESIKYERQQIWLEQIETDVMSLFKEKVCYAPEPDDVNWRNLAVDSNRKFIYTVIYSVIMFVIFFFLSSPPYIVQFLEIVFVPIVEHQKIIQKSSVMDFLNPLMMVTIAALMPLIVAYVCQMVPYHTISEMNHSIMINLTFFMIMAIIILPSAGFSTINAMLNTILNNGNLNETVPSITGGGGGGGGGIVTKSKIKTMVTETGGGGGGGGGGSSSFRWQCLFPVDNGAYFIIYIIHSMLLGNLIELLRLSDIALYALYYILLRSEAEYQSARRKITVEFPLGPFYSQILLIFTMTILFCLSSPIIAPIGLLYQFTKYLVDRHNIYNVYTGTKINSNIHITAIITVYIALILMMFQLFMIVVVKSGFSMVAKFVLFFLTLIMVISMVQCIGFWVFGDSQANPSDSGSDFINGRLSRSNSQSSHRRRQRTETGGGHRKPSTPPPPPQPQRQPPAKNDDDGRPSISVSQDTSGANGANYCIYDYTPPVFLHLVQNGFFQFRREQKAATYKRQPTDTTIATTKTTTGNERKRNGEQRKKTTDDGGGEPKTGKSNSTPLKTAQGPTPKSGNRMGGGHNRHHHHQNDDQKS